MTLIKAKNKKGLQKEKLRWTCNPELLEFESTESIKPFEGIIGQQRALKALKLGVEIDSPGYNVFIAGLSGTGKFTTVKKMLEEISPDCHTLYDYAYVNNFRDPDRPKLLKLPAGNAGKFKKDLRKAIRFLRENIPNLLEAEPFSSKRKRLMAKLGESQEKLLIDFETKLRKENFTLGQVKSGEFARPEILMVVDNKPMFIQQLDELIQTEKITKREANNIIKKYAAFEEELQDIFKKSLQLSQQFQKDLEKIERDAVEKLLKVTFDDLKKKFKFDSVVEYLEDLQNDIRENLDKFKTNSKVNPLNKKEGESDIFKNYDVNIILDNADMTGCPVVIETSPTFTNIFGTIERTFDPSGGWYADYTKIKAGSLLRANGGYLVLNAVDAFSEPGVWKSLKRVMLYGMLEIQDFSHVYQFSPSILKPQPIEINAKIIFIGNNYIYSLLSNYESDFNKLFKVKAEFDYEMDLTESAMREYAGVIKKIIERENLLEFNKSAIARIIEYSARYAGRKNKLTTRFAYVADLAREASFWAKDSGAMVVSDYFVDQAFESYIERDALAVDKMRELIKDNIILIDTDGKRIGQVNGLAVFNTGKNYFGKPTRITASVSLGNGSIINVEREAGLSGNTHNKGVLIISGYFREKFGKNIPLAFRASLVFEQGYGKIDGDSASVAEICALLSTISEISIKQSLSVTGSINQKGDVQPIGGVNEKIEGFFDVCKNSGLTGRQGVIIPEQNVDDLMLKTSVVKAVEEGKFHIYAVSKVEEAVEILTGIKAGKLLKNGHYEKNTVFGEVERKLIEMRKKIKQNEEKSDNSKKQKKQSAKKTSKKSKK